MLFLLNSLVPWPSLVVFMTFFDSVTFLTFIGCNHDNLWLCDIHDCPWLQPWHFLILCHLWFPLICPWHSFVVSMAFYNESLIFMTIPCCVHDILWLCDIQDILWLCSLYSSMLYSWLFSCFLFCVYDIPFLCLWHSLYVFMTFPLCVYDIPFMCLWHSFAVFMTSFSVFMTILFCVYDIPFLCLWHPLLLWLRLSLVVSMTFFDYVTFMTFFYAAFTKQFFYLNKIHH